VFFFMFRTEKDLDPDAALDPTNVDADGDEPAEFSPDPEAIYAPESAEPEQAGPDTEPRRGPDAEL
jgi:hypothetical protein